VGWERVGAPPQVPSVEGKVFESCRFRFGDIMKKIRDFRELRIWIKACDLAKIIYDVTDGFPKSEIYGLSSQLRRAVVSVSSNIAEGCGRRTSKDFVGFLYNAMGSVGEVESQLIISGEIGYLDEDVVKELIGEVEMSSKMLMRFIEHVLSECVE